jgi:transcriptional regulator with XRE-family HTH domain
MVIRVGHESDAAKRIRLRQGETMRKVRTMRGMSIHELAEAVGVTDGAVSQWETGRFSPRSAMQVRIAKALDVPWSMLFALDAEAVA